jgi:hypothetical protein
MARGVYLYSLARTGAQRSNNGGDNLARHQTTTTTTTTTTATHTPKPGELIVPGEIYTD